MKVVTEHRLGIGFLILVNKCLPHEGVKDEGSFLTVIYVSGLRDMR